MPSLRLAARISCASLLVLIACKYEPDDKPAADPLEDPWVNSIDTGDDGQAMAAAEPATAAPVVTPSPSEAAVDDQAVALAELNEEEAEAVAAEPAAAVLASPTASTKTNPSPSKPAPSDRASKAVEDAPSEAETQPLEPTPAVEPTPVAEPAPTAEPAEPAAPPPITIADFHGNYRFVGGSAQRSNLEAAIEAAADQLPGAIRGIGRRRLTKTNPIDDTLAIEITGDKVKTIFETGFDAECVIDGATVHWTSDKGDKYKVRVRAKGNKLVQIIEGEDGVKTTVFVLSADRKKLTVHHKISADRLPEPMTYRLSYSRK